MEDEGEISMKGKAGKNVDYNEDVISDDGHIWLFLLSALVDSSGRWNKINKFK